MLPENDDDLLDVNIEQLPEDQKEDYQYALLKRWEDRKKLIAKQQDNENILREKILDFLWPKDVIYGTEKIPLQNGYVLELEKGQNVTVDQSLVRLQIDEIKKLAPELAIFGDRVFRSKYELAAKEYKNAPQEVKTLVNRALGRTAAKPTAKIIPPKDSNGRATAKEGHEL